MIVEVVGLDKMSSFFLFEKIITFPFALSIPTLALWISNRTDDLTVLFKIGLYSSILWFVKLSTFTSVEYDF